MVITIDGPVASGKSSIARLLAERLGFYYLNTGLLYRAVAYVLWRHHGVIQSPFLIEADDLFFIPQLAYRIIDGKAYVFLNDEDITAHLVDAHIDQWASLVSESPVVRDALLEVQRRFAIAHNVIADGRDCGSVVFPGAQYKFYVDAALSERARRLFDDPRRAGDFASMQQAQQAIVERDTRDKNRAVGPLQVPANAIMVDTTHLSVHQAVEQMLGMISS